jgi:hypothetical protein
MELRTTITPIQSEFKITHQTPVMFIGSCFASEIGRKSEAGKIPVMINPHGTLFNPVSVAMAINRILNGYHYTKDDLFFHNSCYYSLSHYTAFRSTDPADLTECLNLVNKEASGFLKRASFLFVTFGTAWLFDLRQSGTAVANCHKLPADLFNRRQAEVQEIVQLWLNTLDVIHRENPSLRVWFTVSPVRHMNDGAHGNQLSKARLLLAIEDLLDHPAAAGYFPAYEIFMDDLRDYRYYASDMLHPSDTGIQYVWEKFTGTFFNNATLNLWTEAEKITRSTQHRITVKDNGARQFAFSMLDKIRLLKKEAPFLDFNAENNYFISICE